MSPVLCIELIRSPVFHGSLDVARKVSSLVIVLIRSPVTGKKGSMYCDH